MLTVLLKKHTRQSTWYLFQVTDGDGYPQVSPTPTPVALGAESSTSLAQLLCQLRISGASLPPLRSHPPASISFWKDALLCDPRQCSFLSLGLSFPSCEMSSRALCHALAMGL